MQISLFRQFRWISLILITVLLIVFILRLPATAEIPKNYKELEYLVFPYQIMNVMN